MNLNKIMVIIDPTQEQQPAFERGLDSARLTGARLHIYVCLNEDYGSGTRAEIEARFHDLLEQLVTRAETDGVEAHTEIDWAEDWSHQVARAAARCSASMVFKDSFQHSDVEREKRATSDWTLLRISPCPVLMVKKYRDWRHLKVLASIKSHSTDEAHIKLNNQIIGFAQRFTDAYGFDAHFVSAYNDRNHPPERAKLAEICGAPEEHVHIVEGAPARQVSEVADKLGVDLIIIGTVARSGIKGQIVGNTSERLLDHTEADVLVLN
ncbi:MAG: universal stress protein [Halieaceae bacterium]|nr:universal stress protein [Halieaceae bacterium]